MRSVRNLVLVIMALFTLSFSGYAYAKPFYVGKTITVIVCTRPGGGYDLYGRLMAKFMQKYLPGSTIIVRNVPGAGHIVGANEIYNSKPDGLVFGTFNRALAMAQVAGLRGIRFNLAKMSWLGSPTSSAYALIMSKKSHIKTLKEFFAAKEVKLASMGLGSLSHVSAMLFAEMLNLHNVKLIVGYGGSEAELAMMRGEVQGQFASWGSLISFVKQGEGVPVMFIGKKQPKGYANVPLLSQVVTAKKYQAAVSLLNAINVLGRPFAGPPGIPPARLKILRTAFKKACEDPEFVKIAARNHEPADYTSGQEAEQMVKHMLDIPPKLVNIIKTGYKLKKHHHHHHHHHHK